MRAHTKANTKAHTSTRTFLVRLALLVCAAGLFPAQANAILGGSRVPWNSPAAQSVVSLAERTYRGLSRAICSAVVVGDHSVVTAAHCVAGKSPDRLVVVFGTDAWGSRILRQVRVNEVHPEYEWYGERLPAARETHDIAVLVFDGALPAGFLPAQMAQAPSELEAGSVWIAGFGDPDRGFLNACRTRVLNSAFSRSEIQLVASSECSPDGGDSGGATFRLIAGQVVLLGIHNWGWGSRSGVPSYSVEAALPYFAPWIESVQREFARQLF